MERKQGRARHAVLESRPAGDAQRPRAHRQSLVERAGAAAMAQDLRA